MFSFDDLAVLIISVGRLGVARHFEAGLGLWCKVVTRKLLGWLETRLAQNLLKLYEQYIYIYIHTHSTYIRLAKRSWYVKLC